MPCKWCISVLLHISIVWTSYTLFFNLIYIYPCVLCPYMKWVNHSYVSSLFSATNWSIHKILFIPLYCIYASVSLAAFLSIAMVYEANSQHMFCQKRSKIRFTHLCISEDHYIYLFISEWPYREGNWLYLVVSNHLQCINSLGATGNDIDLFPWSVKKEWDFRKEAAYHNCTVCAASLKKFTKIVKTTLVRFCYWSQAKSILQNAVPLNYLIGDPEMGQAQ